MEGIVEGGSGGTSVACGRDNMWMPPPWWRSRGGWAEWSVWGGEREYYRYVVHDSDWKCGIGRRAVDWETLGIEATIECDQTS